MRVNRLLEIHLQVNVLIGERAESAVEDPAQLVAHFAEGVLVAGVEIRLGDLFLERVDGQHPEQRAQDDGGFRFEEPVKLPLVVVVRMNLDQDR